MYRTRKPSSFLGLLRLKFRWCALAAVIAVILLGMTGGPWFLGLLLLFCTGRHFAYVGETVTFVDRHGEHMFGGGRWGKRPSAWSDLDAECVLRIPLGKNKKILRFAEAILIFFLFPVYNDRGNRHNPRRIPLRSSWRMRNRRDFRRIKLNVLNFRTGHLLVLTLIGVLLWTAN